MIENWALDRGTLGHFGIAAAQDRATLMAERLREQGVVRRRAAVRGDQSQRHRPQRGNVKNASWRSDLCSIVIEPNATRKESEAAEEAAPRGTTRERRYVD
jgi:hypothetical protein